MECDMLSWIAVMDCIIPMFKSIFLRDRIAGVLEIRGRGTLNGDLNRPVVVRWASRMLQFSLDEL